MKDYNKNYRSASEKTYKIWDSSAQMIAPRAYRAKSKRPHKAVSETLETVTSKHRDWFDEQDSEAQAIPCLDQ